MTDVRFSWHRALALLGAIACLAFVVFDFALPVSAHVRSGNGTAGAFTCDYDAHAAFDCNVAHPSTNPADLQPPGAAALQRAARDDGVHIRPFHDLSAPNNPVPDRLARVVDADFVDSPSLGAPGASDVFVTSADDIAGLNSAQIGHRLTLLDDAGKVRQGPFAVIEFDTPTSGLASPINRTNPGFVGYGQTADDAREFVLPNVPVEQLGNVTRSLPR